MTVNEFLAWNPPDSDRWELIAGAPRAMPPASPRHGAIQAEAARLMVITSPARVRPVALLLNPGSNRGCGQTLTSACPTSL